MLEPAYAVSGMHRCGTSMMMDCLIAGGMEGNYTELANKPAHQEHQLVRPHAYHPNPNGFFEGRKKGCTIATRGMVAKGILSKWDYAKGPDAFPADPFWIIIMRRPEEERIESLREWKQYRQWIPPHMRGQDQWLEKFHANCTWAKEWMVEYHDCIRDPRAVFQRLADDGWPINVDAAASKVDPSLYRHRSDKYVPV